MMLQRTLLPILLLTAMTGCGRAPERAEPDSGSRPAVFVSIPPQKFIVDRIAGDLTAVEVLLPAGQSPATYEPTPQQLGRLSGASLYIRIGVPFEKRLMGRIGDTIPRLAVLDTRRGIEMRQMEGVRHGDHIHASAEPDPHTWLDPRLVIVQARTIHDALVRILPGHREELAGGLQRLTEELQAVHQSLTRTLEPLRGRSIYVFHPAYGYLTDAYGLRQVAVEVEGKEPGARQLTALITRAREEQVTAIFYQPQFASSSVETLAAEIGGTAVEMDPMAEDYLENLKRMSAAISRALRSGKE